ncbi:hypothetical protein UPYG_G00032120 [Umbra pygmaea]|uniref:SH3-containing GRB2-like protein 3-interacting protein 1 n=1 Tax=Umbra pygmaea TaxID=75934 RepID=A0ABD0Y1L8_UMBPY
MMEGLKKRTRKAFGIRKKDKGDKDNDSAGSPDREGGSQKKANGAAVNGFSGEIDWDRYNAPPVDEEGNPPGPKPPKEHFFSSSESEGEEDHRRKFKIKIKPLPAESACLAPSVDELKASIGNIALSPSPQRRSPGLITKDSSEEMQVVRPRRPAPIEVPMLAAPALQASRSKRAPVGAVPEKTAAPVPEKTAAPVPEDTTALFGPPLETTFGEQTSEVVISEAVKCDIWGTPLPETHSPDFSFTRPFPRGTPPPLPPKNVPTSPPPIGSPSADATGLSIAAEGSERKASISNLDSIFGPAEPPALGEESAEKWRTFQEPAPPLCHPKMSARCPVVHPPPTSYVQGSGFLTRTHDCRLRKRRLLSSSTCYTISSIGCRQQPHATPSSTTPFLTTQTSSWETQCGGRESALQSPLSVTPLALLRLLRWPGLKAPPPSPPTTP